jgi:hypothetical protein
VGTILSPAVAAVVAKFPVALSPEDRGCCNHAGRAHAAPNHARDTLDEAYRRAFREQGTRMRQLGETASSRAVICTAALDLVRLVVEWTRVSQTDIRQLPGTSD